MEKLTDNQKNFLLSFFENEAYAGWKNIATILIESGKCIVAGDTCIWRGGMGNYIDVSNADGLVGCLVYKFNLDSFMTSYTYMERLTGYLEEVKEAEQKASILHNDILKPKEKEK